MKLRRRRSAPFSNRYRQLVEQMPLAVYISALDRTSHALYVSPAIVELLGYPIEEWRRTRDLFERALHEDDRKWVLAAIAESKATGLPHAAEYRLRRSDGSTIWVKDSAVTVNDARGRPLHWQGFLVDITPRKEAESRYRTLVEQLPLVTYIDLPDEPLRSPLYISPQIETILGYTAEEWQSSDDFYLEHVHPDDRERVAAKQTEARRTGEQLVDEYRFLAKDGRVVWLQDMQTMIYDDGGRAAYALGFALDVTARKEAEQDRERLLRRAQLQNERLRDLDRMKDEFIALVSHELRTPLTSIRGYLELLTEQDGISPAEQSSFLHVIERNAARLERLVEDLLLAAQAEAESLHLALEEIDLAKLAVDCIEACAPAAAARQITLGCTVLAAPVVRGDAGRLAQVVDNLLSNALKFTPTGGGVHLRVSVEGDEALLEVADSGMGIPDVEQAELFTRFFRTTRAQREAIAGVGLGLSIAKSLVEAHGGRIGFTSIDGEGTTFAVRLPIVVEARVSGAA